MIPFYNDGSTPLKFVAGPFVNSSTGAPISTLNSTTLTTNGWLKWDSDTRVNPTSGSTMTYDGVGYYLISIQAADLSPTKEFLTVYFDWNSLTAEPMEPIRCKKMTENKFNGQYAVASSENLEVDLIEIGGISILEPEVYPTNLPQADLWLNRLVIHTESTSHGPLTVHSDGTGQPAIDIESNSGEGIKLDGGTASLAALSITNPSGKGADITAATGLSITGTSGNGLFVESDTTDAVIIKQNANSAAAIGFDCDQGTGGVGIRMDCKDGIVINAANKGIEIDTVANNAIKITSGGFDAVEINGAVNGISSIGGTGNGLFVGSTSEDAIKIQQAAANKAGILFDCDQSTGGTGVQIDAEKGVEINGSEKCVAMTSDTVAEIVLEEYIEEAIAMDTGDYEITELTNKEQFAYKNRAKTSTLFTLEADADSRTRI
jgi:hypothetical protein